MEEIQELYDKYSMTIYKYILSVSNDEEIAKDIMQITFLEAIKSLKTFKNKSSVKTWLIGIAKNQYYTYLKNNPFNETIENVNMYKEVHNDLYMGNKREDYKFILKEINSTSEPQRQILILRLINDLSFKDIGKIINKSENYCRVTFFREKQKLIKKLRRENISG